MQAGILMSAQNAEYVVGFSGTRVGMTDAQKIAVDRLLSDPRITYVVHGDCVGADAEFHKLARDNDLRVIVCPPTNDRLRAFCQGDYMNPPLGYLTRNQVIVKSSDYLVAAPKEMAEQEKGGTWYTVRFARKKNRKVVIVWPDGTTQIDGKACD